MKLGWRSKVSIGSTMTDDIISSTWPRPQEVSQTFPFWKLEFLDSLILRWPTGEQRKHLDAEAPPLQTSGHRSSAPSMLAAGLEQKSNQLWTYFLQHIRC